MHVLSSRALRLEGTVWVMASPDMLLGPADNADDGLLVHLTPITQHSPPLLLLVWGGT